MRGREVQRRRGEVLLDTGACCGRAAHLVARADSSTEPGIDEQVVDAESKRAICLELAAGGPVRGVLGVVLVSPAFEVAEQVLCAQEQAPPVGVGRRRLQGHHELAIHGTVDAAIRDADGHRAQARFVGRPSANAGDQEREEHLEAPAPRVGWSGWGGALVSVGLEVPAPGRRLCVGVANTILCLALALALSLSLSLPIPIPIPTVSLSLALALALALKRDRGERRLADEGGLERWSRWPLP